MSNNKSCLVLDSSGKKTVNLTRGYKSSSGHPDWKCEKIDCPIRVRCRDIKKEIGAVYLPMGVRLGTIDGVHGIINCEGAGSAERRSS